MTRRIALIGIQAETETETEMEIKWKCNKTREPNNRADLRRLESKLLNIVQVFHDFSAIPLELCPKAWWPIVRQHALLSKGRRLSKEFSLRSLRSFGRNSMAALQLGRLQLVASVNSNVTPTISRQPRNGPQTKLINESEKRI